MRYGKISTVIHIDFHSLWRYGRGPTYERFP